MMSGASIVVLVGLATVGVGSGALDGHSVEGVVIKPGGNPAPGADVLVSGGLGDSEAPRVMARTKADDQGRFALDLSGAPSTCARPRIWAYAPDSAAATWPLGGPSGRGRGVRLVLGPPSWTEVSVSGPDGRPIVGAQVFAARLVGEGAEVPEAIAALTSSATDASGKAILTAFRPEELLDVKVDADGYGIQPRSFRRADGLAAEGIKAITLISPGRVKGRVVSEDSKAVAGLSVSIVSSAGRRGSGDSGVAESTTDAEGRFEVPAIAAGTVTVRVRPRGGSPDLPARTIRRALEVGRELQVEIPLRRGVRVTGRAVDDRDGRPIAGASITVVPSGSAEPSTVATDAEGRFEAFVPAGLVGHRVLDVPAPYLCPAQFIGPRPVEVPPAIARFELPTIKLTRGVDVRGVVVDEGHRPVPGARVEASWTAFDGRTRAPRSEFATSGPDGSFVVGPVAPDSEVSLAASSEESASKAPVMVRTPNPEPVELAIAGAGADAPTGRVVDPEGRPIEGASVRIWATSRSPGGAIVGSSPVRLGGSDEWSTDSKGWFRAEGPLRPDREYRAIASAEGHVPGRSRALRPSEADSSTFEDLVLTPDVARVAVEGRALDRQGRPIVGASVRISASGRAQWWTSTDAEGQFRLTDVPDSPSFLFAEAAGFRFQGQPIRPGSGPFQLTLTRLDEPAPSTMTTHPPSQGGMDLARRVIAPYADRVLSEGDHATKLRALEMLARVDPKRVLSLIAARAVEDSWFADHLRHAASCSLAGPSNEERIAIVEAIGDPEWRALAALDAADAFPPAARALRRDCVEHALKDARAIREPSRRVVALARVADRLIDLNEVGRASRLLDEARPIAESLPPATSGARARVEFAGTLARVDPAGALALTEGLVDPGAFDRGRLEIARHLAGRDPARASRVLDSLRDRSALTRALPSICHALAPVDPALARQLLARAQGAEPCLAPYALGMMALAVADRDKATATAWLREAFDRLGRVAESGPPQPGPARDTAAVAAALLPVAERVDPGLVPELFWRAVSFHAPRPGGEVRSDALLALMLARYDRGVARTFLEPLLGRAAAAPESDLDPLVVAAAILDPNRAVRLVEGLPDSPDLTFHHPKNEARLALAAALARGTPACWDDATARLLNLWVAGPMASD